MNPISKERKEVNLSAKQIHVLLSNTNKEIDLDKFQEHKEKAGNELRARLLPNAKELFHQYEIGMITHHELINGLVSESIGVCRNSELLAACVQFDRTAHMSLVGVTRFDQFETWLALLFDMRVDEYYALIDTTIKDELTNEKLRKPQ